MRSEKVSVLRLGHRFSRDKRTSTHIALVARAFGAGEVILDVVDKELEKSISGICSEWGGRLEVRHVTDWKGLVRDFQGERIHLTMYGININDRIEEIKKTKRDKLLIVGGQKVPSDVYQLVDYNLAVGNQPHSEVAALAVFLDRLFEGKELESGFRGKKRIIPREKGKKVVEEC
ncbi:MAG: tRNA (cytidine(56)-2'-O)-methyltransferase [Candidatus Altiarchaeota archaeon]|nr:tRNA (cytidine(56)-2'-O)-methyltransferase [Candidatus Altiarchaeota archaeon]